MNSKTFVLIGNQNCGKTTLFNALTQSNQYVGNWPGVTVDKVVGKITKKDWDIVDLPGLYSLSPYSAEEVVSRNFLLSDDYDVILNIVDGSHLDRSLSLTLEVAALGRPMVVALNMMDVVKAKGISIDVKKLSSMLGVEVVDIAASKKRGLDKLKEAMQRAKAPAVESFYDAAVVSILEKISNKLPDDLNKASKIFISTSLLQSDDIYINQYQSDVDLLKTVDDGADEIVKEFSVDAEAYFPMRRYAVIDDILAQCRSVRKTVAAAVTSVIDKVVLNRILALPIFMCVVGLVYFGAMYFTSYLELIPFDGEDGVEYATITDWVNDNLFGGYVTDAVGSLTESAEAPLWLQSLAVDGVVAGVGAVLGFLPQIIFLFIFLSFLEQSGYMTRVAFVLDRIFRKFGLSGKNFIPLVIATGCGVPALMGHKTIDNINERRIGLISTTFIPCSAKLPIMTMIFTSCFEGAWWFAPMVYALAIFSIVCTGVILKKSQAFKEDVSPFVMEIPDYHMPRLRNIIKTVYQRSRAFVIKAGTVIFTVVVIVWFLANFGMTDGSFGMIENVDNSLLAAIGSLFAFIFIPLGFGSWQATVAIINGLLAKENVVGTMAVVLGLEGDFEGDEESLTSAMSNYFSSVTGAEGNSTLIALASLSFLAFNLFSTPCAAALGAMKRQLGSNKWWVFAITYMTLWAYSMALIIYQLGGLMLGVVPFSLYTICAFAVLFIFLFMLLRPERKNMVNLTIPSKCI